jgi:hypothetical protein
VTGIREREMLKSQIFCLTWAQLLPSFLIYKKTNKIKNKKISEAIIFYVVFLLFGIILFYLKNGIFHNTKNVIIKKKYHFFLKYQIKEGSHRILLFQIFLSFYILLFLKLKKKAKVVLKLGKNIVGFISSIFLKKVKI